MGTGTRTVAVVTADGTAAGDVAAPLTRGGFAVRPHPMDASPPPDAVAVLVLVDAKPDVAAAFTRRCRAAARFPRPVLWLFAADAVHSAPTGFDAGADVCLVRPVDADVLTAQLNALLRRYAELTRTAAKGADAVDLSERLGKLFRQADADAAFARRTLTAFAQSSRHTPWAESGVEAAWVHHPAARGGVNTFALNPTPDGVRFALTTAGGLGATTGAAVVEALTRFLVTSTDSPPAALTEANRRVRELALPDAAVVSATVGVIAGGRASVACGGHPPPVLATTDGPARLWHGAGPFLGQSDSGYTELAGDLKPGDRLLLLAGGAAADKRPDVRAAADDHRGGGLEAFVQAVAGAAFTDRDADDGFTLLAVGLTAPAPTSPSSPSRAAPG